MVIPPPQSKVAPVVVELADNVTLSTVQVRLAGAAMLTFGVAIFCVTVVEVLAVQPFAGSITVTEYEPAAETVLVFVVTPPPQSYVAPVVVELAVKVTLSTAQVRLAGAAMLTFGVVMF